MLARMTTADENLTFLLKFTRELCRLQLETMIEVTALKTLVRTSVPNGPAAFDEVARQARTVAQPLFDRIAVASDQALLDTLVNWRGPVQ